MIAKMKKLTLLVYHKEYEHFLMQLRELGVVHIVQKQCGQLDEGLLQLLQKHAHYKDIYKKMLSRATGQAEEGKPVEEKLDGDTLVALYESLCNKVQDYMASLASVDKEISQMESWGDFSWDTVKSLEQAGYHIRFYVCPKRDYDDTWSEQYNAIVINEDKGNLYFVTVTPDIPSLDIEPVRLPAQSLSELRNKRVAAEESITQAQDALDSFCRSHCSMMARACVKSREDIDLLGVKLNGEALASGSVILLEGWIPEENEPEVKDFLDKSGIYYEMRNATKEDAAPIKFKNNPFVRMYEVLTKMYGMPDYAEFDPTPLIAPFFTLFFAFCIGDAGYGLILIALALFLKRKLSKSLSGILNLVITLGAVTAVFGTILGTCFGVSLFDLELPGWLKQFMIVGKVDGTSFDKQMLLALIIGVVHICIAMTVKAIGETVRYGFLNSLSTWGWLLLVVGFIVTGSLSFFQLISEHVSTWAFAIIGGVAAIGIYLLNNIHRNVLLNIGAGIWDTYNMATGLMGDTLSYIRLYALGLAGGMLGGVFNLLAFQVNDAAGGVLGWICCGLILVFGHSLNIAMSCLSAFVHPLRLTFVEYFKNSGYDGKGEPYKPFALAKDINGKNK